MDNELELVVVPDISQQRLRRRRLGTERREHRRCSRDLGVNPVRDYNCYIVAEWEGQLSGPEVQVRAACGIARGGAQLWKLYARSTARRSDCTGSVGCNRGARS